MRLQFGGIGQLAFFGGGGVQCGIRRRAPNEIAQTRSQFVATHQPFELLILDAINKARRLQHGLDHHPHRFIKPAAIGHHGGGDAAIKHNLAFLERPAQQPFAHRLNQWAHHFVGDIATARKARGKFSRINLFRDNARQLRVSVDVLEAHVEIVGGVGKPIGAHVRRQQSLRFGGDVHASGGPHGGDVLRHGEPANPVRVRLPAVRVHGGINACERPMRAAVNPLLERGFFFGRKRRAFLRHFIFRNHFPNQARA